MLENALHHIKTHALRARVKFITYTQGQRGGKKNLEQISSVFTEEIYTTSVSSIPTALTNPPTAYQIKPPLEAQTHSLSHTQTHVCKNNPLPA